MKAITLIPDADNRSLLGLMKTIRQLHLRSKIMSRPLVVERSKTYPGYSLLIWAGTRVVLPVCKRLLYTLIDTPAFRSLNFFWAGRMHVCFLGRQSRVAHQHK
jgi:hypothetical protein